MLHRIVLYLIGLILSSIGFSLIIVYLSCYNVGYSFLEILLLIFKNPSIYLFLIGSSLSLYILFYDLIKKK